MSTLSGVATSAVTSLDDTLKQPKLLPKADVLVLPGDCLLRHEKDIIPSLGTYLKNGYLFSSVAGRLEIELTQEKEDILENEGEGDDETEPKAVPAADTEAEQTRTVTKRVVRVLRPGSKKVPFLEAGSIVTARVLRTTSSFAKVSIHCIEDYTLKQPYTGIIRSDDIRDYEKDKLLISRCLRPGDIVLARVFATGENHQFLLTTAAPELGVVIATNDWGEPLVPLNLKEMVCQRTLTKEPRKVANIVLIA